jgi:hypothetical protein
MPCSPDYNETQTATKSFTSNAYVFKIFNKSKQKVSGDSKTSQKKSTTTQGQGTMSALAYGYGKDKDEV